MGVVGNRVSNLTFYWGHLLKMGEGIASDGLSFNFFQARKIEEENMLVGKLSDALDVEVCLHLVL